MMKNKKHVSKLYSYCNKLVTSDGEKDFNTVGEINELTMLQNDYIITNVKGAAIYEHEANALRVCMILTHDNSIFLYTSLNSNVIDVRKCCEPEASIYLHNAGIELVANI